MKKGEFLKVVIFDPNVSESFSLEIPFEEAIEIMNGEENYDYLISLFKIQNEEIVLINSKGLN